MHVTALIDSSDPAFAGAVAAALNSDPDIDLRRLGRDPGTAPGCVAVMIASRLDQANDLDLPLIIVDHVLDETRFVSALDVGANAYVTQAEFLERGGEICREVLKGNPVVPPQLLGALLRQVIRQRASTKHADQWLSGLTPREREVFTLAARGMGRAEIAGALFVSVGTIRTHMQRIFKKLNVHSQAELAALPINTPIPSAPVQGTDWLQAKPTRHGELWERRSSDETAIYNPDTGVLAVLNPTALAVWELCDGSVSGDEVARAVARVTGLATDTARRQTREIFGDLGHLGLIRMPD